MGLGDKLEWLKICQVVIGKQENQLARIRSEFFFG